MYCLVIIKDDKEIDSFKSKDKTALVKLTYLLNLKSTRIDPIQPIIYRRLNVKEVFLLDLIPERCFLLPSLRSNKYKDNPKHSP